MLMMPVCNITVRRVRKEYRCGSHMVEETFQCDPPVMDELSAAWCV